MDSLLLKVGFFKLKQVLHDTINWQYCDFEFIFTENRKNVPINLARKCGIRASSKLFAL